MQKDEENKEVIESDGIASDKLEEKEIVQVVEGEKEEQVNNVDFIYQPTELGKAIVDLLADESQENWEKFFVAFYDKELWFGAFIEKSETGEDVLYPIPSVQEDGTENLIVFEKGSELADWYNGSTDEDRADIFLVAKTGDRFLLDIAPESFEKFNDLLISYGRADDECFILDKETLKIMRETLINPEES